MHTEEIGALAKQCHPNNAKRAEGGLLTPGNKVPAVNNSRWLGLSR